MNQGNSLHNAAQSASDAVVVIGAGPAGLTAADRLCAAGVPVTVLEQDSQVGGIARTVHHEGFRFDIGGHRFFTKVPQVAALWQEILGRDFLLRPRQSRILFEGRFFDYPLKPLNALKNLGLARSILILLSYLKAKLRAIAPEESFEDWVTNRFGKRLYGIFFKTYTEKVWGISCRKISAQWAAQRIKGLSLRTALLDMMPPGLFRQKGRIKTLIEEFHYPRLGPGMMWDALAARTERGGGRVVLESRVTRLLHDGARITAVEYERHGERVVVPAAAVISTMPLSELVPALSPAAPSEMVAAARRLNYRDFLTVALIIDQEEVFPDNWIYVHDESVRLGRVQNFKNWSPALVPDPSLTCLGLEYFCFAGDELWSSADEELVALATREISAIGLVDPERVLGGKVVRMPKAYPVYDEGSLDALAAIKEYLAGFDNLQLIGRNGMHRYNNMDHSMLTALLAVRNILGERHDLFAVNSDEEYLEEKKMVV